MPPQDQAREPSAIEPSPWLDVLPAVLNAAGLALEAAAKVGDHRVRTAAVALPATGGGNGRAVRSRTRSRSTSATVGTLWLVTVMACLAAVPVASRATGGGRLGGHRARAAAGTDRCKAPGVRGTGKTIVLGLFVERASCAQGRRLVAAYQRCLQRASGRPGGGHRRRLRPGRDLVATSAPPGLALARDEQQVFR